MRETAKNLVHHRLITAAEVTRLFCAVGCVDRWLDANLAHDHGARYVTDTMRLSNSCGFCSWDGEVVAVPVRCYVHSSETGCECPDYDPLYTVAVERAVLQLRELTGGDLPPRAFDFLVTAARLFREAKVTVTSALLVERMMDVRVDWLR